MIEIRKRHPVFGLGGYEELSSSNPSVLAFVREHTDVTDPDGVDSADRILCVNNLSRFPQPVELDLRRFKGVTPVECMGGRHLPADRGPELPAYPARARFLLVPAARAPRMSTHGDGAGVPR